MQGAPKNNDKRFMITLCNSITSLVIFLILFVMYISVSGDEDWQKNAPYEVRGYAVRRNADAGVFERDAKKPVPGTMVMDTIDTARIDHAKTKEAVLAGMGCASETGSRCSCYTGVVDATLASKRTALDDGSTTWAKTWKAIIADSETCAQMSASWELHVWESSAKVLLGTLVWWSFSTAIVAFHLFLDWEVDDWFYKGLVLLFGILLPAGLGGFIVYSEEGLTSTWFLLFVTFIAQHVFLKIFIHFSLGARNDDQPNKNTAAAEFDKKNVMASLTAFAVVAAARLSQLFSGANDTDEAKNITTTAIAIGLLSISLRLLCGSLEVFEADFKKDGPDTRAKRAAFDHRKAIVFSGQWIWSFAVVLGLLLTATIPLDSGDGLVEGSVLSKFALGLVVAALVLQFPGLTSSHNQWLSLQVLEGLARLVAFGTTIIYCVTGK